MKYKITAVVEQDKEYSNADQIKELSSDIQMNIANYNCFHIVEDVKAEEYRPDIRQKVKEYIAEIDEEISRCETWIEENMNIEACKVTAMETRAQTLNEIKCDLESRLEELV